MNYFNERKGIISLINLYSTESQWKLLINAISTGLHEQIVEYCKFKENTLKTMLAKIMFANPKGEDKPFSFLDLPPNFLDSSQDLNLM